MTYPLARMIARAGKTRRKTLTLPPIVPTSSLAMELAQILVAVPRAWNERRPKILAAYERAIETRSVGDRQVLRDAGGDDLTRELEAAEAELERLILILTPQLRDWTIKLERWHRRKFVGAVLSPTGVDLSTLLGPAGETVDSFRQSILALIRNIDDDTRNAIAGDVWRGFQGRTPRRTIARQIAERTEIGRKRALFIASDQTQKMGARLDQARQEEAGFEEYEWMHSGKLRPRPVHVARNGQIYRWDKPPADGHPGSQPYCGCKARAHLVIPDDDED